MNNGEPLEVYLQVYSLEEVVAEKLRAILQHSIGLKERGWSRTRARDYFDLWRILSTFQSRMDLTGFEFLLRQKCAARGVAFSGPEDFFEDSMLANVNATWIWSLGPLVPELPPFDSIIDELRPHVTDLVTSR